MAAAEEKCMTKIQSLKEKPAKQSTQWNQCSTPLTICSDKKSAVSFLSDAADFQC